MKTGLILELWDIRMQIELALPLLGDPPLDILHIS